MTKNKVIHARIDDNIHDRLFEKCNELGCSFTDYIESVIESSLEDEEPSKAEITPIKEKIPHIIIDSKGNYTEIKSNS